MTDVYRWIDPFEEIDYWRRQAVDALGTRVYLRDLAVHHLDGNPHNNDPANLRIVDPKANRRG
jgi:hypothetical protein